jgi:hypothetical protein
MWYYKAFQQATQMDISDYSEDDIYFSNIHGRLPNLVDQILFA